MMGTVKRGYGNVFLQKDPIEEYEYLTSTGVGDITTPKRPRTIKYDPDVRRSGEFLPTEFIRGEPGEVTASLARPLDTVRNYLQELDCPANARLNWACRGDRNIVWNYELAMIILGSEFESGSTGQPVIAMPSEEDRVMTSGDLKGLLWTYLYLLLAAAQTVDGNNADINDIVFLPEECGDRCGPRVRLGCEGYAGRDTLGYLLGDNVLATVDCGQTPWDPTAVDPFLGSRDVLCMITVETSTGHRLIVGGSGLALEPAAVAYSDDEGATWNTVTVGAVNNQSVDAITRDELGAIWVACSAGYVYKSINLAMTWTAQHSATETVQDLNGIAAVSSNLVFAVGNLNALIYSPDGGTNWEALTGPVPGRVLWSVSFNRYDYLFITAADGTIHRSIDEGESWAMVLDMNAGSIRRARFDEKYEYFGYAIWNDGTDVGHLLRSEDGGVTWMQWDTPVNTGLLSLFICDPNMVYVCGNGGFIAKFDRAPD
jgi:photosystem II stability/assembly factor-like uncharacterized protein